MVEANEQDKNLPGSDDKPLAFIGAQATIIFIIPGIQWMPGHQIDAVAVIAFTSPH
jgi:hypothetical protein